MQKIEDEFGKNFLIIGITSNEKRHIQYNPYPKEKEINHAETHIKNIVLNFLPSVLDYLNINLENTNKIVAGASLLQLYTGFVYRGPSTAKEIKKELIEILKAEGIKNIEEAVGKGA